MRINILYNDKPDEFANDLCLETRLKNYITTHFYPAYTISILAPIYLVGGGIRDLICAKKPKDLDFVVLGKQHLKWVLYVLDRNNIKYNFNKFGGYKFIYEGTEIDLWLTEDLFSSIQYNVDGLLYNLNKNSLLSLTFEDFIKNDIKLVNTENNINNDREKKLLKFKQDYLNNNS